MKISEISVVMCSHNGQKFIWEQLESIKAQTVQPFELIVCDDNSSDRTVSLVEEFSRGVSFEVRIHRNPQQLGSTLNFQQGIQLARGSCIVLCDQDDVWCSEKLARLSQLMEDPAVMGIFTDADLIDEEGTLLGGTLWSRGHLTAAEQQQFCDDPVSVLLRQDVATGATMIFRTVVRDLYRDIPKEWVHDGWLTWMITLNRLQGGSLQPSSQRLIRYRVHQGQQTGSEAIRSGSRAEPLATRLAKARTIGHAHHAAAARRLELVLNYWASRDRPPADTTLSRLQAAVRFLKSRAALPGNIFLRSLYIATMLRSYFKYGRGFVSVGRDLVS